MRYVEAPEMYNPTTMETSIFLAGGITNCPEWQQEMVGLLQNTDLIVLNPRRVNFLIHDPGAAPAQITWEHRYLWMATSILFWFPCETLCPIVLYELGAWSMTKKRIFVGTHSGYKRKQDVEIQTRLARPDVEIVYSLQDLAGQVVCGVEGRFAKCRVCGKPLSAWWAVGAPEFCERHFVEQSEKDWMGVKCDT